MLGAVAGDIIGSPFEFNNTNDRYFDLCRGYRGWLRGREVTFHPKFTDETVMTLAVARWLMSDNDRNASRLVAIMQSMGRGYIDCGFGKSFRNWILEDNPIPHNSYTNVAASRVSPIAMAAESLPEAISLARMTAQISHLHPEGIKGAEAMAQAVWMARHGRSKDDIRFAMTNDFGYDLSSSEEDMRAILLGAEKEPILINGEETDEFYYRETGKIDTSCQNTIPAALQSFLAGDSFEDVVRRAVAMGGDSDSIASLAGAIAAPFYGGVPEKISHQCDRYLDSNLRSIMSSFENTLMLNKTNPIRVQHRRDDSFKIIKCGERRTYVVESYRKELIEALKARFGDSIEIVKPSAAVELVRELSAQHMDGTYLETPRPDIRTVYFQDGEFRTSVTMKGENLPSKEIREESKRDFLQIHDYALKVKERLQHACGYFGEGSIHFANAYYPEIFSDKIEIWKGDVFAGSVGIDPQSGLLRINQGGDFGPMEWFGDRTESVFNSVSPDSIKESIARFCLDEGIGIFDKDRTSNIDVASKDAVNSKDPILSEAISASQQSKQAYMKR